MIANQLWGKIAAVLCAAAISTAASASATIVITNINAANVGFNDPTPATPVGGNTGTTLGQQRLNAFAFAANIWGATLNTNVTININAQFTPLTCTATTATLGSAGAASIFRNFNNAPLTNTWYPYALANKLAGADVATVPGGAQINANFSSTIGLSANCLPTSPFYLGFDGLVNTNAVAGTTPIDLVAVLLHEMGHGFGFQTFTNAQSGAFNGGFPSIWDYSLLDNVTNLTWNQMTNAQRAASSISGKLVWSGAGVTAAVPSVLAPGTPELAITAPSSAIATYLVGTGSPGPQLSSPGITAEMIPLVDQTNGTGLACNPLTPAAAASMVGKIALVDRGTCTFAVKADNIQAAGALAMVVADNAAGSPPAGLALDNTVVIPVVRITQAAGVTLRQQLAIRSRTKTAGVIAKLDLNLAVRAGADAFNRMLMYAPNPFISGSSVSHYDTSAFPNQLMEPNINSDLTHSVLVPVDLTYRLLQDIGW